MNKRLELLIERYRQYCQEASTAAMSPAATEEEIATANMLKIGDRTVALDADYLDLVRITDGLGADGTTLYSIVTRRMVNRLGSVWDRANIGAANREWRESYKSPVIDEFLIYGKDDTSFFIRHLPTGRYQHRSRRGLGLVYFDCGTFEECIWEAFRYPLELGDFPGT